MSRRLLMCSPRVFDVVYEINAWMSVRRRPDLGLAERQWAALYELLTARLGVAVELVEPRHDAPDMVFAANSGLARGRRVWLANFRHPQRQVEAPAFRDWFAAHGYEVVAPPDGVIFEGEGDALFAGETLLAGYLQRSSIASHAWLAGELGCEVLSLELVDPRWYHLDTALFVLAPERVVWWPAAFDPYAQRVVRERFATVEVERDEALRFACNAVVIGREIVMPAGCPRLGTRLETEGYHVHPVDLSEFIKSGGAAKCLVLWLDGADEGG